MSTFEIIMIALTIMAVIQAVVEITKSKHKRDAKALHLEERVIALEEYISSLQNGVQILKEERLAKMGEHR
jgi:hypothetical protein